MRKVIVISMALFFTSAANSTVTFSSITFKGEGIQTRTQENMCYYGPCEIDPPKISPYKLDITYTFSPVSVVGWQTIYSPYQFYYWPGTYSIVSRISFFDGAFVEAYGFRDSDSDLGCYYSTSEERYTPTLFTAYSSSCSSVDGEPFGFGIRTSYSKNVSISQIIIGIDGGVDPPLGVPEPAAWAIMIIGFGLTGNAIRRRACAGRGAID